MADDLHTINTLATINDRNLADIDVTDLLDQAPFLATLNAVPASNGTSHKYVKETGAPVVGFRAVNDGREHDKSDDTLVTVNLAILDASFKVDLALASEYRLGTDAFLNRELERHLRAAFFKAEKQFWYGTTAQGDSAGFLGINNTLSAAANAMVTAKAGTATAPTSVYLVRTGENDCSAVLGNEGNISASDPVIQEVAGSVTGTYPAWYSAVTGWMTLQLGSAYSIHRIANVETATTGDTLTDDIIYEALAEFPSNKGPDYIVMHRYARRDLQKSRTATNSTGTPAPIPTDVEGIPIIVTDSLRIDETIVV